MTPTREERAWAAIRAEWERRQQELQADPTWRRLDLIVHAERRDELTIEFRKSCRSAS